jgi:hypothetical protein
MMRTARFLLVVVVLLLAVAVSATITFQRSFIVNGNEAGYGVRQTPEGNYAICATVDWTQAYVFETDSIGVFIWDLMVDWFSDLSTAYEIELTPDDALTLTGACRDSNGMGVLLAKMTLAGDTVWVKKISDGNDMRGYRHCLTEDGGYAIAGWRDTVGYYGGCLVKTDSVGDTLWTRFYFDVDWPIGILIDITETPDGGLAASGLSRGIDDRAWLVRTDSLGDTLWTRRFPWGPSAGWTPAARALSSASNGGFLIAGSPRCNAAHLDSFGDAVWDTAYVLSGCFYDIAACSDGGYLLVGMVDFGSTSDGILVRINSDGDTLWTHTYGSVSSSDLFSSVHQTNDGGFILTGVTEANEWHDYGKIWLVKLDSLGLLETIPPVIESTTVWTDTTFLGPYPVGSNITDNVAVDSARIYENITHDYSQPDSIVGPRYFFTVPTGPHPSGSAICYQVEAWDISQNYSLDSMYCFNVITSAPNVADVPTEFALHAPAPNPFNPTTRISFSLPEASHVRLEVFDLLGRKVATLRDEPMAAGEHEVGWDASSFSSGVYLVRLCADDRSATAKLVLLK